MRDIQKTCSEIVISENYQNQVLEMLISMKFDVNTMRLLSRSHSLNFMKILKWSQKKRHNKWSRQTQIVELEKKQGQIWNQRPLKRWRPPWRFLFRF